MIDTYATSHCAPWDTPDEGTYYECAERPDEKSVEQVEAETYREWFAETKETK